MYETHQNHDDNDELETMCGDVNLFLNDIDGNKLNAEIEVMIAEKQHRGCSIFSLILL